MPGLRTLLRVGLSLLAAAAPRALALEPPAVVETAEQARIDAMSAAAKSVVCIFDEKRTGGGSGVIITADGLGLTNFHVVMEMLETRHGLGGLSDGKLYPLEVLGIDPTGDVAMFKLRGLDGKDATFTPAPLGDSDTVRVGDAVFAMGNPFLLAEDYTPTATHGIVSGLHRYQFGEAGRALVYTDCIQVDASINPGNSGGPLFDMNARLIGINGRASFEQRGRVNVGLGYAISINQIKRFMPALRSGYLVEHGSLGATTIDLGYHHVVFEKMLQPSVASDAGITVGDRLLRFAGQEISSANQFLNILMTFPAGWPVEVVFEHDGQTITRTVRLERLPLPKEMTKDIKLPRQPEAELQATTGPAGDSLRETAGGAPPTAALTAAIAAAQRRTVKVYGAGIGCEHGYGTGILVSPDGDVITVLSLVLEATDLQVVTDDGRVHAAEVAHRDEYRQLALLKLSAPDDNVAAAVPAGRPTSGGDALSPSEPEALARDQASPSFAAFAPTDSASLRGGDWVLAVGNVFKVAEGDEPLSVMKGVVAGRSKLRATRGAQPFPYLGDVILLDAITSGPGSPGSAVVDLDGRLVGLVGKTVTADATNTFLNYALPAEELAAFLKDAQAARRAETRTSAPAIDTAANPDTGSATQPDTATVSNHNATGPAYHGILLSKIAYHRQLPFVQRVIKGSPADRAGLKADDLIISANGTAIPHAGDFTELCERLHPGDELSLVVKRGDGLLNIRITLAARAH
jgi:S1-C subfamily serine protease